MADFDDRYQDHPVHQQLAQADTAIETAIDKAGSKPEQLEALQRARAAVQFAKVRLGGIDPILIPTAVLRNLASQVETLRNHTQNFLSDASPSHIPNIGSQTDTVLQTVTQIPVLVRAEDVDAVRDTATSFRRSAGQLLRHIEDSADGTKKRLELLDAEVKRHEAQQALVSSRVDSLLANFQEQFSKAEETRREKFSTEIDERLTEIEETISNLRASVDGLEVDLKADAAQVLDDLRSKLADATRIVGAVATTGNVGGFQKVANEHRTAMWIARVIALSSLCGMILFGWRIYSAAAVGLSWQALVSKVLVVVGFGLVAAFAAKIGERHELEERRSRRLELELASVGPFLSLLPEKDQHEVKRMVAEKVFAAGPAAAETPPNGDTGSSKELLRFVLETLLKRVSE